MIHRPNRRVAVSAVVAATLAALPLMATAQTAWPRQPIRLVVTFPPGGAPDILARLDRKSTRLNSSHSQQSRMPSSA